MNIYGSFPLACGKTDEIRKLQKALGCCFAPPFEVEDVGFKGLSVLHAEITNSNTDHFEEYFRPSMVYVVRAFIDRYGLGCDGGEYDGYVAPDPENLKTFNRRTVEECIEWKNIDEIFGKGSSEMG